MMGKGNVGFWMTGEKIKNNTNLYAYKNSTIQKTLDTNEYTE